MEWILLVAIGLIAGTLGSLMGLGGGIVVVPALMMLSDYVSILAGITPQVAVGTSLLIMIFTGLSSTIAYLKQKLVDYISGAIFLTGSIPGALFGVYLNKETAQYGFSPWLVIPIAFVVGMLSGLFGIGGGSLMVPAMILLFGFPPHMAVATSMFMIFFSAISSSISHIVLGNVDWLYALALIPGAWVGGKFGAVISQRLKSDTLVRILRIFLIVIGARLVWQGFTVV